MKQVSLLRLASLVYLHDQWTRANLDIELNNPLKLEILLLFGLNPHFSLLIGALRYDDHVLFLFNPDNMLLLVQQGEHDHEVLVATEVFVEGFKAEWDI